jgi:hypothetical protein
MTEQVAWNKSSLLLMYILQNPMNITINLKTERICKCHIKCQDGSLGEETLQS